MLLKMPEINVADSSEVIRGRIAKMQGIINSIKLLTETDPSTLVANMAIIQMQVGTACSWERFMKKELNNEERYQQGEFVPNWLNVRKFLEKEAQLNDQEQLARVHAGNSESVVEDNQSEIEVQISLGAASSGITAYMQMNEVKARAPRYLQCPCCPIIHPLYKCDDFKLIPLSIKKMHVANMNLCERCLKDEHEGWCKDPRQQRPCPNCLPRKEFHNSVMCPTKHTSEFREQAAAITTMSDDEEWNDE